MCFYWQIFAPPKRVATDLSAKGADGASRYRCVSKMYRTAFSLLSNAFQTPERTAMRYCRLPRRSYPAQDITSSIQPFNWNLQQSSRYQRNNVMFVMFVNSDPQKMRIASSRVI